MIKYSYLGEHWDGVLELPELDDRKAVRTILTNQPGIRAIWRLALDHETPDLGKCLRVWTIGDLSFKMLVNLLITWVGILKYKNFWNKVRFHASYWNKNWHSRLTFELFIFKYRVRRWMAEKVNR